MQEKMKASVSLLVGTDKESSAIYTSQ
jgi:hypothetical protein